MGSLSSIYIKKEVLETLLKVIDKKYRIKTYEINYDSEVIEKLKSKVVEVREFIKTLKY